jgi:hypothetical protein
MVTICEPAPVVATPGIVADTVVEPVAKGSMATPPPATVRGVVDCPGAICRTIVAPDVELVTS